MRSFCSWFFSFCKFTQVFSSICMQFFLKFNGHRGSKINFFFGGGGRVGMMAFHLIFGFSFLLALLHISKFMDTCGNFVPKIWTSWCFVSSPSLELSFAHPANPSGFLSLLIKVLIHQVNIMLSKIPGTFNHIDLYPWVLFQHTAVISHNCDELFHNTQITKLLFLLSLLSKIKSLKHATSNLVARGGKSRLTIKVNAEYIHSEFSLMTSRRRCHSCRRPMDDDTDRVDFAVLAEHHPGFRAHVLNSSDGKVWNHT